MATKKKEELGSSLLGVSDNTAQKLAQYQAGYQEGERVQNAYNEYNQLKQNAPQAYVSPYQQQLDDIYAKITNRQPFKYNLNGDMLYQNAKEQYQQLGKQAMVDTIGQATQLTGGYNNSYAQNVGNQAYQQYLLKLNELIPDYYRLAMERYNAEGDQLNNQYALARDMEDQAYGRYRDTVSDYNNNLQMAYNIYGQERDNDYGQYADALNYWMNMAGAENTDYWKNRNFDYQAEQDALDRAFKEKQLQQEMAYKYASLAQSRANAAAKQQAEQQAKQQAKQQEEQQMIDESLGKRIMLDSGKGGLSKSSVAMPGLVPAVQNAVQIASTMKENDPKWTTPDYSLHGIGGQAADMNKVYDYLDQYQRDATSEDEFVNKLLNTMDWYASNGNFNADQIERILKRYGLTNN